MEHIFASSSLTVTGSKESHPSQEELSLPDTMTIAELLHEKAKNQGKDDSGESNRETLS
jgi:hypothetical protein